jgi:hypothetical protein
MHFVRRVQVITFTCTCTCSGVRRQLPGDRIAWLFVHNFAKCLQVGSEAVKSGLMRPPYLGITLGINC